MKRITILLLCFLSLTIQAQNATNDSQKKVWPSFLTTEQMPDGTLYLPAPPAFESQEFVGDIIRYHWGKSFRETPRGQQAIREAEMNTESLLNVFSQPMGMKLSTDKTPELAVIAAGSLLGLALNRNNRRKKSAPKKVSFPVGKVNFLEIPPMTFVEFLDAVGESEKRARIEERAWASIAAFHASYSDLLKRYCVVGGMPEAVSTYSEAHDFAAVRKVQQEILLAYDKDFAKHAPSALLPKIRLLWNAIPAQLAKENKKLIYTALRPGARAREYETALQWLEDAGMVRQVHRVSRPGMPLKSYEDFSAFKLYAHDVGLLAAMSDIPHRMLIEGNRIFTHFKGALTEQFVLGELVASGVTPYYWATDEGMAEVEFVVQGADDIYPLEVKAERNLQSKSLKSYRDRFAPSKCLRSSLAERAVGKFTDDIPLYAIGSVIRDYL